MAALDGQLERAIDRRVQARLATDRAYVHAEDAEGCRGSRPRGVASGVSGS